MGRPEMEETILKLLCSNETQYPFQLERSRPESRPVHCLLNLRIMFRHALQKGLSVVVDNKSEVESGISGSGHSEINPTRDRFVFLSNRT